MGTGNGKAETNQGQIKIIVRTLAAVLVLCVIGIFWLLYSSKTIPTELWMLTSNSFTALATMLVKTTPTSSTQDVHVTNPAKDPVNTADQTKPEEPKL